MLAVRVARVTARAVSLNDCFVFIVGLRGKKVEAGGYLPGADWVFSRKRGRGPG